VDVVVASWAEAKSENKNENENYSQTIAIGARHFQQLCIVFAA